MIADLAGWRAAQTPHRPAAWFDGRWHDYAELDRRAHRLAGRLAERGIGRGDRVAILAFNHLAHLDLLLAAPKLGFVFTPFNYRLSLAEQQALARYVRPSLLLADSRHGPVAKELDLPTVALDGYEAWIASAAPLTRVANPGPEDAHMILFTGGSTGVPKGAVIPYRQVWANAVNTGLGWKLSADDCVIQATPMFHAALNVFTTPLLHGGGRVVLLPQFEPGEYLAQVAAHRPSHLFMVPTMYRMLADHPDFAHADFSSVKWAISGGAPCPPPVREAFAARGVRFRQGFGMTEAGVNCFCIETDEAAAHPDSVGRPLPNTRAVIRRADGSECAMDEVGELTLAGPQVCAGYYERPEEWARMFRDGWLWTGDLARRDAQGLHYIVGRSKEMYISGGENIYPAEVEAALAQCEGVAECAVFGVPHPKWGEIGVAAVALEPGARRGAGDLQAELRSVLAGYKVPREFRFLDALPKTGAGKIAKPELRRQFETGTPT